VKVRCRLTTLGHLLAARARRADGVTSRSLPALSQRRRASCVTVARRHKSAALNRARVKQIQNAKAAELFAGLDFSHRYAMEAALFHAGVQVYPMLPMRSPHDIDEASDEVQQGWEPRLQRKLTRERSRLW
jgi:hypothetical protein